MSSLMVLLCILGLLCCPLRCCAGRRRPGATPPLGWSTWCTGGSCGQPVPGPASRDAHDVCTESEIKSIATEMQRNGMRAAGYEYIMLNDCCAATRRTPSGQLAETLVASPPGTAPWPSWRHGCMLESSCWVLTLQLATRPAQLVAASSRASLVLAVSLAAALA